MKRLISLLLCLGLLSGFSAYALGASATGSYDDAIEEAQALCEEEAYEEAYTLIRSIPPCAETAVLLEEMIENNTLDMTALRADYSANSVRAEKTYSQKFFFIRGTVSGFSSSVFGNEDYMILDIEDCSDDVHCYNLTEEEMLSVNKGDEVIVAGNYFYDYGWIGIDFRSCSMVDPSYLDTGSVSTSEGNTDHAVCPNCGKPVTPDGKFCSYCGKPLT